MVFRCPNIQASYNKVVLCLNFGIPENNWLGSEPEEAPQNRSSTLEFCVKSTSNISRICTMSSLISKKPLTEYGMQPYGPPCGSTISVQI